MCTYCLGHYTKELLYKHVKICKNKPASKVRPGRKCLTKSQTFTASVMFKNHQFLKASCIKDEVFSIMRADDISAAAKTDPLICLYGEALLNKHKRQQMSIVVSNKIREMARLLLALKSITKIQGLFEALKPELFQSFVSATKMISGYDYESNAFKAPSLVLHMGTSVKLVCDVMLKIVIEKRTFAGINWSKRDEKKREIKDFQKLTERHWCTELSSLALKTLKERHWEKPSAIPLTSDIKLFHAFTSNLADTAYSKLQQSVDVESNYKTLTECVLAETVMFNRKRMM